MRGGVPAHALVILSSEDVIGATTAFPLHGMSPVTAPENGDETTVQRGLIAVFDLCGRSRPR
jgi:hypothetical protein